MTNSTSEDHLKLYKGIFNWYGDVISIKGRYLYCRSASEEQAFQFFCKQIASIVGTSMFNVRHYFYDSNKYTIEEVKKNEGENKTCTNQRN